MSQTSPGSVETYTNPATGVKKFKNVNLGNLVDKVQSITAAGAIDLDANHVKITGPATSTYAITLAAPARGGQTLVVEMVSTTDTNAVTLALTNVSGQSSGTTATFNAANETMTFISNSTKWVVLDELGVTCA